MNQKTGFNLGRAIGGGVIVLLGLLFLLHELGILDVGALWRNWPLLFVIFGLAQLAGRGGSKVSGVVFILIGLFLRFGWGKLWPLFIIAVGLLILWSAFRRGKVAQTGSRGASLTELREFIVFGGSERRVTSSAFRGGDVTTVFGAFEVDLREATAVPEGAVLDVATIFGGLEIRVPEGWEVIQNASVALGGYEDHTTTPAGAPAAGPRSRLTIRGFVLFGAIEVRN